MDAGFRKKSMEAIGCSVSCRFDTSSLTAQISSVICPWARKAPICMRGRTGIQNTRNRNSPMIFLFMRRMDRMQEKKNSAILYNRAIALTNF